MAPYYQFLHLPLLNNCLSDSITIMDDGSSGENGIGHPNSFDYYRHDGQDYAYEFNVTNISNNFDVVKMKTDDYFQSTGTPNGYTVYDTIRSGPVSTPSSGTELAYGSMHINKNTGEVILPLGQSGFTNQIEPLVILDKDLNDLGYATWDNTYAFRWRSYDVTTTSDNHIFLCGYQGSSPTVGIIAEFDDTYVGTGYITLGYPVAYGTPFTEYLTSDGTDLYTYYTSPNYLSGGAVTDYWEVRKRKVSRIETDGTEVWSKYLIDLFGDVAPITIDYAYDIISPQNIDFSNDHLWINYTYQKYDATYTNVLYESRGIIKVDKDGNAINLRHSWREGSSGSFNPNETYNITNVSLGHMNGTDKLYWLRPKIGYTGYQVFAQVYPFCKDKDLIPYYPVESLGSFIPTRYIQTFTESGIDYYYYYNSSGTQKRKCSDSSVVWSSSSGFNNPTHLNQNNNKMCTGYITGNNHNSSIIGHTGELSSFGGYTSYNDLTYNNTALFFRAYDVSTDSSDNIYVLCHVDTSNATPSDPWNDIPLSIIKFDSTGNYISDITIEDYFNDIKPSLNYTAFTKMTIDNEDNIYIYYANTYIDEDNDTVNDLANSGYTLEINALGKYNINGNKLWIKYDTEYLPSTVAYADGRNSSQNGSPGKVCHNIMYNSEFIFLTYDCDGGGLNIQSGLLILNKDGELQADFTEGNINYSGPFNSKYRYMLADINKTSGKMYWFNNDPFTWNSQQLNRRQF